ncbi:MAG: isocitrate lyase/PEP mutase family protein [Bacilli bacterium]
MTDISATGKTPTRKDFRRRIASHSLLIAPGAYDALTAKLVEQTGFEAVYLTGGGVSYSTLAQPDVGLVSVEEMVQALHRISSAVNLPVIADADNGYGNELNVLRTVRSYEQAGAYAIQIEDQTFPKKCGHLSQKSVLPTREAASKIRAAAAAREDPDTLIIARTDALAVNGMRDALERARRFEEAGADMVFVEAPESVEQMQAICEAVQIPCVANMVEGGRTPLLPAQRLQELGYRVVIYPNFVTRILARHVFDALQVLRREGISESLLSHMMLFPELNRLLGIDDIRAWEARFAEEGGC